MRIRTLAAVAAMTAFALPAFAQPPGGGPPRDPAAVMAAMDTNKDGSISLAEWTAGGRPEAAFARIDANMDGKITAEELANAPRGRPGGGGAGGPPPAQ